MFGKLFGQKQNNKKDSAPDLSISFQKLRQTVDTLEKREVHLQTKIDAHIIQAREKAKRKDKKGAMIVLKQKKLLETQLESTRNKRLNLETQIGALEEVAINKETLKAMQTASTVIRSAMSENEVDRVEDLMEEMNENVDQIKEIDDILSQPLGPQMDEDELQQELAELQDMDAADWDLNPPTKAKNNNVKKQKEEKEMNVPDVEVPTHKVTKKKEEAEELAELEAMTS